MKTPSTPRTPVDRFLQTILRSGLLGREQLMQAFKEAPAELRSDAEQLSVWLVERDLLSHFQARKLLDGIWQGFLLGPYQILAPLGRGGMGTVYLARNTEPEGKRQSPALIALKILPPKRAQEESRTLARFQREMELGQRLEHPHITKTFEAGVINGVYFIAMEYIRGENLRRIIAEHGTLPVPRVARLFAEVAEGLEHAHKRGLIHRDLKPSNIMVTPNGHAKILDLGLALAIDEEIPHDKTVVGGQGYVVGTMDYIAPEQVDDPTQVDGRADLYAVGCSMYFALTGQPPFPTGTSLEKMQSHREEIAVPIQELNPTIPIDFAKIVEKLMAKKPARRFADAAALREALLPWIKGDPERPLDVNPHQTEIEALHEVEGAQQAAAGLWWDDVPVISFEATTRQQSAAATDTPAHSRRDKRRSRRKPSEGISPAVATILILVCLLGLLVLLELIRR